MKLVNKSLFFVPGLIAMLVGCGSEVKESADKIAAKLQNPALMHTWERDQCSTSSILGVSSRIQFDFSGNVVKRIEQYFSSANCVDLAGTVTYSGSYQKKEEVQKDVNAIDLMFTSVRVTALNESGQKLLNNFLIVGFCGKKDWAVNVPVDLTAHNRDTLCPVKALPEPIFDIYSVEGNKFYFGKGDKKATLGERPVQLDREVAYHQL